MKHLVFYDDAGRIVKAEGYTEGFDVITETELSYLTLDEKPEITNHYVEEKKLKPFPIKPSEYHVWDYESKAWRADANLAVQQARAKRDQLLAACDWTQLNDIPLATKKAWLRYRQALRDLTDQPGFPAEIQWPTPP